MVATVEKRGRGRPRKEPSPAVASASTPDPVRCGETYKLADFLARTGLGLVGLRNAQAEGLRVVYLSKLAFVRGDDWHEFIGDKKRKTRRWDNA